MKLGSASVSSENNQILLSPEHTTLIIVDHQVAFETCFDANAILTVEDSVEHLSDMALKVGVPVISSFVKTNLISSELNSRLEQKIPKLTRFNRSTVNPWDDPAFADAVRVANRSRLLIAGLSAETSMSFTALCALERGFDVYVVKDACLGHSPENISTTFERLLQAGVVPVSWQQIMLEWSQGSVDAGMLRRVLRSRRMLKSKDNTPQGQN